MNHSGKLSSHYLELASTPISPDNFAGEDVRYSGEFEALEAELGKASALHANSQVDWQQVQELSAALLRSQSKDLRVAAWLTWALHQRESFPGLQAGLAMLLHLCEQHWNELHPRKPRTRAAAASWLVSRLEPLFSDNVPVKDQLPLFSQLAENLRRLEESLGKHLGEQAPLLLPLCRRLDEMVQRASQGQPEPGSVGAAVAQVKQVASQLLTPTSNVESEKDAHKSLRGLQDGARPLCAWWLRQKATDLRALRLNRTLLWLPIDSLPERNAEQITALRGLPQDKRNAYRERFEKGQYADLLVDLETSLARAPFWFDGHRLAWECLQALNDEVAMREVEIQFALFLQRLPGVVELRFHDGIPFAAPETRGWISAHVLPHLQAPASVREEPVSQEVHGWEQALQDALPVLRKDGLKSAVQLLKRGLQAAHGGRQRFLWQLTMARLCFQAKKYELARTQLESLDQELQDSGLHAWEPDLALQVLHLLHSCCELLPQNHSVRERKDEVYRRLCHLDLEVVLD
ncbi:type VI secretion system protein TssA [Metapseudomonas lalkuanensis]|uniref:type VI secretion system protein TssA n=1 Tax=Metapseudomonas lalkuanensis TaxID=2604832 RepID=UPI001CF4C81A|nr:type VI secretion system protein TssA [Pseudomonas lalkuanensis]UCO98887.1 type VI secretion system protein TssA [Pseudomonas lalkuanensis]